MYFLVDIINEDYSLKYLGVDILDIAITRLMLENKVDSILAFSYYVTDFDFINMLMDSKFKIYDTVTKQTAIFDILNFCRFISENKVIGVSNSEALINSDEAYQFILRQYNNLSIGVIEDSANDFRRKYKDDLQKHCIFNIITPLGYKLAELMEYEGKFPNLKQRNSILRCKDDGYTIDADYFSPYSESYKTIPMLIIFKISESPQDFKNEDFYSYFIDIIGDYVYFKENCNCAKWRITDKEKFIMYLVKAITIGGI